MKHMGILSFDDILDFNNACGDDPNNYHEE